MKKPVRAMLRDCLRATHRQEGDIWEYQIGGYQVCDKWLKDRKGRSLSLDDIKHYCNIVTSIKKTIEIQKAIDEAYGKIE
ncbi:MAG: type ISP restriction/modification enzyme [Nitrospinota bacterium]